MVERKEAQDEGRLFRVRVCRITNGERLPLVVGPDHLPVPTPNQWMLLHRRAQVQAGTLTCEMRTIAHVHEWAALLRIAVIVLRKNRGVACLVAPPLSIISRPLLGLSCAPFLDIINKSYGIEFRGNNGIRVGRLLKRIWCRRAVDVGCAQIMHLG